MVDCYGSGIWGVVVLCRGRGYSGITKFFSISDVYVLGRGGSNFQALDRPNTDLTCSLAYIFELRHEEPLPLEMVKDAGSQSVEGIVFTSKSCDQAKVVEKLWLQAKAVVGNHNFWT